MEHYWKKIRIFNTLRVARGCRKGDNLLSLYLIVHWVVSLVSKFCVKHSNCLITFIYSKSMQGVIIRVVYDNTYGISESPMEQDPSATKQSDTGLLVFVHGR